MRLDLAVIQKHLNHGKCGDFQYDKNHIAINSNKFDDIIRNGGFQPKAVLSWAKKNELLITDKDRTKKKVKRKNFNGWMVIIQKDYLDECDESGINTDILDDALPFK